MVTKIAKIVSVCLCGVTVGCNGPQSASRPIAAGTVESLTVWDRPVQRPGETGENTGKTVFAGSRVQVYDQFILITPPGRPTTLAPHGWYTDLTFKADPQR